MNAAEALTQVRAAGIRVGIDEEALVLDAFSPPPSSASSLRPSRYSCAISFWNITPEQEISGSLHLGATQGRHSDPTSSGERRLDWRGLARVF